jgi:hypothetical protein
VQSRFQAQAPLLAWGASKPDEQAEHKRIDVVIKGAAQELLQPNGHCRRFSGDHVLAIPVDSVQSATPVLGIGAGGESLGPMHGADAYSLEFLKISGC